MQSLNKDNQMQEIELYLRKFKSVILILLGTILIFGIIISRVVPIAVDIFKIIDKHSKAVTSLADKERTLQNLKEKTEKANAESKDTPKEFFKSIEKGLDTESVIANEFSEILTLIRGNSIKTRSIKYQYDPQDDNFVKNVPDKYNVAKLDIEMIGTYKDFEGFLKELYKHEHFLDISSIEVVPYQKDKKILIIKFQLKLYAQK